MKTQLDQTDIGILKLLQGDARLTHKEIAAKLNKSVTPIHIRIRRLQEEGYIKHYTAILDPKKINKSLTVFIQVQLTKHDKSALQDFQQQVGKLPEVMECYHLAGAVDCMLKIMVSDMGSYTDLLVNRLSDIPNIGNLQTTFVLGESKRETAFSL